MKDMGKVIVGENLWQVGFSYDALYLVHWMSGLVRVRAVVCNEHGVFFIVESKDKSGELFVRGVLRGSPLNTVRLPTQPLCVAIDVNGNSS